MKRAVMALSGGMDSTGLLLRLLADKYNVSCLSFNYGQKHVIELERAKRNINYFAEMGYQLDHKIIDITSVVGLFHSALTSSKIAVPEGHYKEQQMKHTVVPNRNAIFSSILYGWALSISIEEDCDVVVSLGVHSGDHAIYPDCRPEFYDALDTAHSIGNWGSDKITYYLPYIHGDKRSILIDSLKSCNILSFEFDRVFANTITSYSPDDEGRSSGRTGSDIERILAFNEIGRKDPIEYVDDWKNVLQHALTMEKEHREMIE
jgi:7-cyano-7-deazaguanine synthase